MSKKRSGSTSSDRWSKASSDSDASFISNPGELRLDRVRAADVKDLLESLAQLRGGRDKKGFLYITILKDATLDDTSVEDLRKVVLYLTESRSPEEQEDGFSFLVLLKATPPYGSIRPLTKVLHDYFPFKVTQIYVVKPDGYRERLLSNSLTSSKYETHVITKDNLVKYISPNELTDDLNGFRKYEHSVWFKMRLAFERFLFESMALSSKLDEIKRSLLQDDIAITVDGVREQLQHHQHVRKWIIKAPIEILAEEAKKVINTIKSSCDCQSEDDLKDEYKNSMHQVRGMIGTLQDQRATLKDLWVNRKVQLDQRFQFNVFMQDAEKMLAWIMENRQEFMCNFSEIGEDLEMAEELREEHKQFEETCGDVQVNIDRIIHVANRLREMQNFDAELVDRLAAKLESEWNKLYTAVERRSTMLEASVSFHRSSEQYLAQSKVWMEELNSIEDKEIDTTEKYEEALRVNNELKQSMSNSYEFVSSDSKHLLNCLQRTPSGDSREEKARSRLSDYTDAASHVMDVIVVLYEQNKQLVILWEKQKARVGQKYKLSMYDQNCQEILKYLRGNGGSFLAKNTWVGDQLEVAEELLGEQHDFETQFQETYLKAKKLLDSANQLAESKECDPQEIRQKQSNLELEVKTFTSKLKKRRELLKMAVSFYKNVQKLSKVSEKLKDEFNLDSVGSVEPQNFDSQLETHRHECESTLEKLLCTVHEGEQLSAELLAECNTGAGKDNRTSWFSAGSNSVEQSRLAVELYLKELNHNRQQLEKMWRGRQKKLDYWVQVKHYERDFNNLYADAMKWNTSWLKKELSSAIDKALSMVERFENEFNEISERFHNMLVAGRELETTLRTCGVEVIITSAENLKEDSIKYITDILKKLHNVFENIKKVHHKLKVKYEFTIKQRKLEADAKKVSGWVRHGESILQASQEAGFSMYEAEALLREYERFHVAIETTRLGVMDIRENAAKLIRDGHPDHESIDNVAGDVEKKWQQLMQHAEERRAVVFSSYNFYRAAEQVAKLLEKFSKDCKCDGDPCEKFGDYELKFRREKIESLIKKSEPERKAVEDGCLKVKECSEEFLKRVLPSGDGNTTPVIDGTIGRLEITVNDLVEQVTSQEAFVLRQIQLRKTVLSGCAEFVCFQESVQETLELITGQGTTVTEGLKSLEEEKDDQDKESEEAYLQKQEEYKTMFLQIRAKVKALLKEASELVIRNHFHRNSVSELATSIDTRYKDLACHMNQYRESLVNKLGCSIPEFEDEEEWPSLTALQNQSTKLSAVTRRDVSNDSGIHEMTEEKRRSVKRIEFIINELIQTEKAYVDDLKCCIENFLIPMYNSPDVPEALHGCEDVIFGNIEMIHEFHSNVFLGELQKYEKCADNVGKCFVEWAEKFHMYVDFCANKPDSNALLIKHGENFFEDLQLKRGLGLSLAAYLIKPVQRITKYQLLLKELLSCCDDEDGTLLAGLEVMLSVPRRANDAMYLCMIKGFDDGSLETLGKILLQDSFTVWDPKHILKKGKERHLFLFEQALLLCKEIKDANGKCTFDYKCKLKTSEMGITEHVAEDKCKFAAWTGNPPFTEEKRIIKAESEVVKHMWVKEIRELIQQFQFGILKARTNFYPTSPRRKSTRKSTSQGDISLNSDSSALNTDRMSAEYDTATICSRTSLEITNSRTEAMFFATDDYSAKATNEISLRKGQSVEVLSKPPGSRSWRVRVLDDDLSEEVEGLVPSQLLRKTEDSPMRGKRSSVETLNSQSSEDSYQTESPKGSMQSVSGGKSSPKSNRRRAKSVNIGGTLKMKTWSRGSAKKYMSGGHKPPLPTTPTRNKSISGGGSKKLQAILGAPESDIDLLIRPSDGKYATLGRQPSGNAERVKFLVANEPEDAGFQEGDYDSDVDSMSDSNENFDSTIKEDQEERSLAKRMNVLRELIESENEYINDLDNLLTLYVPAMNNHPNIPEELKGKEKVIFGNMRELLTFHKESFVKDLAKCDNSPDKVASTFIKSQKKFELYINYCANMPRSACLIHDHLETFFADVSNTIEPRIRLEDALMNPVQRIMKYHTMLKDFTKYSGRAGINTTELTKALHVMQVIPKKADDVMNVGMLEGFTGNLNNQGKLLMQDTLNVANVKEQVPSVERKVFLFEKLLIFGEPLERKSNLLCFIYRHSVETHTLGLTANYDDDLTKFAVWSKRDSGSSEIYVMTARSPAVKKSWVESIKKITEEQYFKARGIPKEVKKILSSFRTERSVSSRTTKLSTSSSVCNGGSDKMGKITPASQIIDAGLQHVKLIPLDEAKSLEELTNPFPVQEKFTVTESYQAQTSEELTVHKNDTVYLVNRAKKGDQFYMVKSFVKEKSGLVPANILKKSNDRKTSEDKPKLGRSSSFGEKTKKDKESSKIPKMNYSATLLRTTSLKRKKDRHKRKGSNDETALSKNSSTNSISNPKSVLDKLQQHWTSNFDSSDDEETKENNIKASESLDRMLSRETKTTSEIAPEFKIPPRDVTVDVNSQVKLTCTVAGYPPPEVVWCKNENEESELSNNGKYRISYKNQLCLFEIFSTELTDTGMYTCTATNSLGTASCSAKVTVKGECKPGVPSRPYIVTSTCTSVTLKWNPPVDVQAVPVHAYSVQYKESTWPDWRIAIPVCNETTAMIDELTTGNKYAFRVSANNAIGMSENSEPSELIHLIKESDTDSPRPHEIRWRENIEEYYNICGELGRGRFSIVKRCVEKKSNKEFAAKIVRRRMLSKEAVESEVAILQALEHPSIVSVHEIYDAPKGLVIVEELLPGGRLFDHIVIMDTLTEEIAIRYIKQLLIALQYLHKKCIAHLDIKPENILLAVGDEPRVVLSDFGEAIRLGSVPYQHELTGNAEFAAPEIVANDNVSLKTDMWSVGVIVYVLLSGVSPFYSDNHERACANVTEIRYKFPDDFFAEISDEAQDFIEELLIRDQAHRPPAEECLGFPWIRMCDPENSNDVRKKRISLARLAAFNARRRYQYESNNQNTSITTSQLLSPEKKSSLGQRR